MDIGNTSAAAASPSDIDKRDAGEYQDHHTNQPQFQKTSFQRELPKYKYIIETEGVMTEEGKPMTSSVTSSADHHNYNMQLLAHTSQLQSRQLTNKQLYATQDNNQTFTWMNNNQRIQMHYPQADDLSNILIDHPTHQFPPTSSQVKKVSTDGIELKSPLDQPTDGGEKSKQNRFFSSPAGNNNDDYVENDEQGLMVQLGAILKNDNSNKEEEKKDNYLFNNNSLQTELTNVVATTTAPVVTTATDGELVDKLNEAGGYSSTNKPFPPQPHFNHAPVSEFLPPNFQHFQQQQQHQHIHNNPNPSAVKEGERQHMMEYQQQFAAGQQQQQQQQRVPATNPLLTIASVASDFMSSCEEEGRRSTSSSSTSSNLQQAYMQHNMEQGFQHHHRVYNNDNFVNMKQQQMNKEEYRMEQFYPNQQQQPNMALAQLANVAAIRQREQQQLEQQQQHLMSLNLTEDELATGGSSSDYASQPADLTTNHHHHHSDVTTHDWMGEGEFVEGGRRGEDGNEETSPIRTNQDPFMTGGGRSNFVASSSSVQQQQMTNNKVNNNQTGNHSVTWQEQSFNVSNYDDTNDPLLQEAFNVAIPSNILPDAMMGGTPTGGGSFFSRSGRLRQRHHSEGTVLFQRRDILPNNHTTNNDDIQQHNIQQQHVQQTITDFHNSNQQQQQQQSYNEHPQQMMQFATEQQHTMNNNVIHQYNNNNEQINNNQIIVVDDDQQQAMTSNAKQKVMKEWIEKKVDWAEPKMIPPRSKTRRRRHSADCRILLNKQRGGYQQQIYQQRSLKKLGSEVSSGGGRIRSKPPPLIIPQSVNNMAPSTSNRYQSNLHQPSMRRASGESNPGSSSGVSYEKIPPYTPPPMLSPMRPGSGLYNYCKPSTPSHRFSRQMSGSDSVSTITPILEVDENTQQTNVSSTFTSSVAAITSSTVSTSSAVTNNQHTKASSICSNTSHITDDVILIIDGHTSDTNDDEDEESVIRSTEPKINLGIRFQAEIPPLKSLTWVRGRKIDKKLMEESDRAELMWKMSECRNSHDEKEKFLKIEEFLELSCSSVIPFGGSNKELALHYLYKAGGDIFRASKMLIGEQDLMDERGLRPNKMPRLDDVTNTDTSSSSSYRYTGSGMPWDENEIKLFDEGMEQLQKDFFLISRKIKTRSTAECIERYYHISKRSALNNNNIINTRFHNNKTRRQYEQGGYDNIPYEKISSLQNSGPSHHHNILFPNQPQMSLEEQYTINIQQDDRVKQQQQQATVYYNFHNSLPTTTTNHQQILTSHHRTTPAAIAPHVKARVSDSPLASPGGSPRSVTSCDEQATHECPVCNKRFTKVKSRNAHMKTHGKQATEKRRLKEEERQRQKDEAIRRQNIYAQQHYNPIYAQQQQQISVDVAHFMNE